MQKTISQPLPRISKGQILQPFFTFKASMGELLHQRNAELWPVVDLLLNFVPSPEHYVAVLQGDRILPTLRQAKQSLFTKEITCGTNLNKGSCPILFI